MTIHLERGPFSSTEAGEAVDVFTVTNSSGIVLRFINYGSVILSIHVPDRDGTSQDITLGYNTLEGYIQDESYLGAVVGRFANRIADSRFILDGQEYRLTANEGPHHLHGGNPGFNKVVWGAEPFRTDAAAGATLHHVSPSGDQGYPGRLVVRVTYSLNHDNELTINYQAATDQATHVNLSQHTYFNLSAGVKATTDHELLLNASHYLPVRIGMIPTGEVRSVADSPFDFRTGRRMGERIDDADEQLQLARGYDHTFVIDRIEGKELQFAGRLRDPESGRTIEVHTTCPGIHVYSGNWLNVNGRRMYGARSGVALETQHFPDSPNQPAFPSTVLRPGDEYRARTIYRFYSR